ncbi:MAG: hypothetical protein PHE49_10350 [bacterium]|nr:hypothetical protein [bacterium]
MKKTILLLSILFVYGCSNPSSINWGKGNPVAPVEKEIPGNWTVVDSSDIVFDDINGWIEETPGVIKSYSNGVYAYLNVTDFNHMSLKIKFKVDWNSSADQTGIFMIKDISGDDGYYFTLYPYQDDYKFFVKKNGAERIIQEGSYTGTNPGYDWVTIGVVVSKVTIDSVQTNEFSLFYNGERVSLLRDSTFSSWTMGFGRYDWYSGGGAAYFKNISILEED